MITVLFDFTSAVYLWNHELCQIFEILICYIQLVYRSKFHLKSGANDATYKNDIDLQNYVVCLFISPAWETAG